jgi:hypothetical protein
MPHRDRARVQVRHLTSDRRAPLGITWVVLVGHTRVADLRAFPEHLPKALDQPVIPFVVRARASTLDKRDLTSPSYCSPLPDRAAPTLLVWVPVAIQSAPPVAEQGAQCAYRDPVSTRLPFVAANSTNTRYRGLSVNVGR